MTDVPALPPFDVYVGDGEVHPDAVHELAERPVLAREEGRYLADPEVVEAVNIAIAVGQPLLLTGEPGCGKTRLAWSVAHELGLGEPLQFYTRSTSRAQDLLYRFDAVRRFHDIQSGAARAADPKNYVRLEALGIAIQSGERRVVLIDEIDKAPRDFPNDLLTELDRMRFTIEELDERKPIESAARPIVIITSNSERQLPLPFLRRCVFHHIEFPATEKLAAIVRERLGTALPLEASVVTTAIARFEEVRSLPALRKQPATGELLAWVHVLHARGVDAATLRAAPLRSLPLWQALLKDREDWVLLREA
jgi:MoxR-like ATPase